MKGMHVVAGVLACTCLVFAQQKAAGTSTASKESKPVTHTVTGVVVSADTATSMLIVKDMAVEDTLKVEPKAKAELAKVKLEERVTVHYQIINGVKEASKISAAKAEKSAKPAAAK